MMILIMIVIIIIIVVVVVVIVIVISTWSGLETLVELKLLNSIFSSLSSH